MGHLSNALAHGRGPRPRGNGARSGPLRKIVSSWYVGTFKMERYECGHEHQAKRDLMGYTNANRRRCTTCKAGA